MQKDFMPIKRKQSTIKVQTSNEGTLMQKSTDSLNGLLSVSSAQISSQNAKERSSPKQRVTAVPQASPPTKVSLSEKAMNQSHKPDMAPVDNTIKVKESSSHVIATISNGDSKTSLKKLFDNDSSNNKPPSIPGSLRPPTGATVRYMHSYITCGTNGIKLVTDVLDRWKWHKLTDNKVTQFTLKWSDLRQSIDFHSYREGEQMVNHYPNSSLLTTKIGLLESLRQHKTGLHHLRLDINQIIPETYRMDVPGEREEFCQIYKPEEIWICKPTSANQGKGIFLVNKLQQLEDKLQADQHNCSQTRRPTARIVQRYISKPLLLDERKFDIRVFLLFVSGGNNQLLAFYHHGYIRLSCLPYDTSSSDLTVHLTNQYVQKKHPTYNDVKEDTVWDFDKFQSYLTEHEKLPNDWVEKTLKYQIKRVMLALHHSVRRKLEQRIGYFELFGLDFMLDSDHQLWLIEVNVNPALNTNCDVLFCILPKLIQETLGIAAEVWSKSRRSRPVFPIEAQGDYEKVFPQ